MNLQKKSFVTTIFLIIQLGLVFTPLLCQEVTTIDVVKALKNEKTLLLSEIVDQVTIIELGESPEAYFKNTSWFSSGENYIMIGCNMENKVMLFDKKGRFLRPIGHKGQGPGEYTSIWGAAMDPEEKYIVIIEGRPFKMHLYDIDGTHIRSRNFKDDIDFWYMRNAHFLDDSHFAFDCIRPGISTDNFSRIMVYDLNLRPVKRYLPIADEQFLKLMQHQYIWFEPGPDGFFFCEGLRDTVYCFDYNNPPSAKYYFDMGKGRVTDERIQDKRDNLNELFDGQTFFWAVHDLPNHIFAAGKHKKQPIMIWYDKTEKTTYSATYRDPCDKTSNSLKRPFIENDIFGLEPIYIRGYQPKDNYIIMDFNPGYAQSHVDIDCFRSLNVSNPKLRDQIADKIENATGEENKILILMHLKK